MRTGNGLPVRSVPPPTEGRSGTAVFFYMAVLAGVPTVVFGMYYSFPPLAAVIAFPFATYKACRLATTRHAAYEDVPPLHSAFVQSCLIWLALACSFPVIFAFDIANTIVYQLCLGAGLAVMGPGVAAHWADLPRQIYVPMQPSPPTHGGSDSERLLAGTQVSAYETVLDEELRDYAENHHHDPEMDLSDDDYERF